MRLPPTVKWVVLGFVAIALGTVVMIMLKRQVAIDRCLDRGGSWNYGLGYCEGARAIPEVH